MAEPQPPPQRPAGKRRRLSDASRRLLDGFAEAGKRARRRGQHVIWKGQLVQYDAWEAERARCVHRPKPKFEGLLTGPAMSSGPLCCGWPPPKKNHNKVYSHSAPASMAGSLSRSPSEESERAER